MSREVEIKLFGAFRQYSPETAIAVSLPESADVATLRQAFADKLGDDNARALLQSSAFATDEAVLNEGDTVPAGVRISILPPVCGG
ncbi:MoaD/ThiS family protein [Natronospira bacteriovora]|uniref:MoaD/ThiS family protein n=1 Tax=Natronospira bacteriovora TaxID=3069753 RepID=A0ABU0W3X9_9GAMM|nr:MoaD/ThiS family protein [Natronospira sp. AB-CW4]MDQ2068672.1 MoaD/ThiS family protein [Natronospira sp. AB-CW4]